MNTPNLIPLARRIAEGAHQGETRRDGRTPYIRHLESVVDRLPAGSSEATIAAAWLHDAVENGGVHQTYLTLAGIPPAVIAAVDAITKRRGEPYPAYLARVKANPIALIVKRADIAANLADEPSAKQLAKYTQARELLGA